MKTKQQSQLLGKLFAVAGVTTVALGLGGVAMEATAGIANTKHNLTASSNTNNMNGGATQEICVFCHTPHAADTSAPVPLWNKTMNTSGGYTTYESLGTSTMDAAFATDGVGGTGGAKNSVGSVSLACLSCHDGTQAMDNIINAPGSGFYDSTGGGSTGRTGATWAWTGGRVSAEGVLSSTSVAMLGQDLRNDHPIGIQYCGGYTTAASCLDTDFKTPTITGGKWYVEASGNSTRDKSDMILYTRAFGANPANATSYPAGSYGSVECASCHDPHVETKATNQVAFLRVSQAQSGVCLACHTK